MIWMILGVLLVLLLLARPAAKVLGARRARRLETADRFRIGRKVTDEDVTVLGEQLAELHVDTRTSELDEAMRADYERALAAYDQAKFALRDAVTTADVLAVNTILDDGRFARACVLARRDGEELPQRRDSCFFNPQHGPAVKDLAWAPPGGVVRQIPVCRSDARRIEGGEDPEVRLVRVGDRYVPWYEADRHRGLLVASFGTVAVSGVPKYVMLEADLNRARGNTPGGGGMGI